MKEEIGVFKLKDKLNRRVVQIDFRKINRKMEDLEVIFVEKVYGETNKIRIIAQWYDRNKRFHLKENIIIEEEVKNVQNSGIQQIQQPVDEVQPVAQSPEQGGGGEVQRIVPIIENEGIEQVADTSNDPVSA